MRGKTSPTQYSYEKMKVRCLNKNHIGFHRYGGRGIKICDEWLLSFKNFLLDMGERPENKTLDRIDNDGNYCKANCRWATKKEQCANTSKNNNLTFDGKTKNVQEWARTLNINHQTIHERLKRKWPLWKVLSPLKNQSKRLA